MLEIGSLIDGKYKILNKIGQGGMSVVYLAMNERANKQWAIKEVRKDGISDFEIVRQGLIVETDLLKRLNHKHLPSIIDVIDTNDTFLIVMDYIEGNPLSATLKEYGAQNQDDVVEWSKQLCDVLEYLHSRTPRIIYRDMKPANVMLKPDGSIMLIDFGTAREFKSHSVADTTCLGTQGYAAPEQFGGQGQTDQRTDIYCLGATMYHLVTGHNPCEPPYEMYPIRQWNPMLSSGLEEIIIKCTQRNPQDRYQSCAELMYALDHYHELDIDYKKAQNKKWWSFITVASLMLISIMCMAGFKYLENNQIKNSYDSYIRTAKLLEGDSAKYQEISDYYIGAARLDPGNPEAYNGFFDWIIDDNIISGSEHSMLQRLMKDSDGQENTNEKRFAAYNRQAFDKFAYWLGVAYYFNYSEDDTTKTLGDKLKAKSWLEVASNSQILDSQQVELAKRMFTICSRYNSMVSRPAIGEGDGTSIVKGKQEDYTYLDYWNDITSLSDGDIVSATGEVSIALGMYQELACQTYHNFNDFTAVGIKSEEMMMQLDKIETGLKAITTKGKGQQEQAEHISHMVQQAREIIQQA